MFLIGRVFVFVCLEEPIGGNSGIPGTLEILGIPGLLEIPGLLKIRGIPRLLEIPGR